MVDLYRLLKRSDVSILDKVMIMIIQVFDPAGAGSLFNIFPWFSFAFLYKLVSTLLKDPSRLSISRLFTTSEDELVTRDPRVIRSFVKYLVKIHIKRQCGAIYRLYLSEILRQNGIVESQERYSTLRDIASDLKNYLDTLPGVKSIFASMVAVFSVFATAAGLLNLGSLLFEYIVNLPPYVFLIVIPVSIVIGYIVTVPFLYAFWFKRHLFLSTGNWYYLNDVYFGNERQLYDNSIYKLEDDLFEVLGARYEKLNEVAFDKIFTISTGTWVASLFAYVSLSAIFGTMTVSEQSQQNLLTGFIFGFFGLLGSLYAIILPILTYRHRRRSGLL